MKVINDKAEFIKKQSEMDSKKNNPKELGNEAKMCQIDNIPVWSKSVWSK